MSQLMKSRTVAYIAVGFAACMLLPTADDTAFARKKKRAAEVTKLQTPFGLQGTRGAGSNVIVPFSLVDRSRKRTDVEVEYGYDVDGDGSIYPGDSEVPEEQRTGQAAEYFPAEEDRLDARDTRKNKKPQLFSTAANIGAAHAYAWKSTGDISSGNFPTLVFQFTPDGRLIPDPNNPGSFLFAPASPGVKMRVRAVRGKGRRRKRGEWRYTDAFAVNNNTPPAMSIDGLDPADPTHPSVLPNEVIGVNWSAYDQNSEDLNASGFLDELEGEDLNGNGVLDPELVAAAFDYHQVGPNENPQSMTLAELAALQWSPCTNANPPAADVDFDGFQSAPPFVQGPGNAHVFFWKSVSDVGTIHADFILRARPLDAKREHGEYAYFNTPFTVDNWKIFNTADPLFPEPSPGASDLPGECSGLTVTNLTPSLERSDPTYDDGRQILLVAGGSFTIDGPGTNLAAVLLAGGEDATTTAATPDLAFPISMISERADHTATMLDDGRVLIVGGRNGSNNPVASSEIFDPVTRTLSPGPIMANARARHAAVRLVSGDVAVFGGLGTSGPLDSVEIFRFKPFDELGSERFDELFDTVAGTGTLAVAQHSLRAAVLPDQTVLVTGGIDGSGNPVRTAQILDPLLDAGLDPETQAVEDIDVVAAGDQNDPLTKNAVFITDPVGTMIEPRGFASATSLLDGNVLFAGGFNASGTAVATMEVFNHRSRQFEGVDVVMEDGPRAQHTAALMGDGSVLLAGGITASTGGTIVPQADLVLIESLAPSVGGPWTATSLPVNGDMLTPRRSAASATINNGRVILAGGDDGTTAVFTVETFTPDLGINRRPAARVVLQSDQQSWAFGAPVLFRLSDAEQDDVRVRVQFRQSDDPNFIEWTAATPQPSTIGGDVAELTSGLTAAGSDVLSTPIDPIGNPEDHTYIWGMQRDLVRPPSGQRALGFNIRVVPFGAVQGATGVTPTPVTVLSNTKVIPTIYPLEARASRPNAGQLDINQGGDITVWVHLRDIDGDTPPAPAPRIGEIASAVFEYAVDLDGDGIIAEGLNSQGQDENWQAMTPKGSAAGAPGVPAPTDTSKNMLTGLGTFSEAPGDSPSGDRNPILFPGERLMAEGWHDFEWDALYDLGGPQSTRTNVQIRVTPSDADEGFRALLRNEPGVQKFVYVRDPDGVWLDTFVPLGDPTATMVAVNAPLELTFNGLLLPASVTNQTVQVRRGTAEVLGEFTAVQNPGNFTTLVTFWPLVQSLDSSGDPVYSQDGSPADQTVLYPLDDYTIFVPGYAEKTDPTDQSIPTILPDSGAWTNPTTFADSVYSTHLIVNNVENTVGFRTGDANTYYDDGVPAQLIDESPLPADGINPADPTDTSQQTISVTVNKAVDVNTVKSPNLTVTIDSPNNVTSVVPGTWTVTNTQVNLGSSVETVSVLTFEPLIPFPASVTVDVKSNAGLLSVAGKSIEDNLLAGIANSYATSAYAAQTAKTITETFADTVFEDETVTDRANWGTDPCSPTPVLTGVQLSPVAAGSPNLTVGAGAITTITSRVSNYTNLTVEKGGLLRIRATGGSATINAVNITIEGEVDFSGEDGWSGHHGRTSTNSMTSGPTTNYSSSNNNGTRLGGTGYNGGTDGGESRNGSTSRNQDGFNGGDIGFRSGGQGGQASSWYAYGNGGAQGGGHGSDGLKGGRAASRYTGATTGTWGGDADDNGWAHGNATMSSGVTAGSGGGGGATGRTGTNTFQGGGGGAGGGAVEFVATGTFNLAPSGYIDGRGGDGGGSSNYGGSGGGGSGGGVLVKAGGGALLDGVIDLRGGNGGPNGFGYYSNSYHSTSAWVSGSGRSSVRYGGDGGLGRLRVLAPNMLDAQRQDIRVFGQLMVRKLQSALPTAPGGPSGAPTAFTAGGLQTYTFPAGTTEVYWSSWTQPATNDLELTGASAVRIHVRDKVELNGTLRLNGEPPEKGFDGDPSNSPEFDGGGGRIGQSNATPGTAFTGGLGNLGGGKGGDPHTRSGTAPALFEAKDGAGPAPGKHRFNSKGGYLYTNFGWPTYHTGDAGGGGAGNATTGDDGWTPYAAAAIYKYTGIVNDTNGKGTSPDARNGIDPASGADKRRKESLTHGGPYGGKLDPTNISLSTLGDFVGSGGGGGNAGGNTWSSTGNYFGYAGSGGGGAGALAIIGHGTGANGVFINGTIEARGGRGNGPGAALTSASSNPWRSFPHAAGGGGSGGTVYIIGEDVTIDPGTSETTGATIHTGGALGGGWRQTRGKKEYPAYNSFGNFGGNGGYGRLVVDWRSSLNGATDTTLFNKWGMTEDVSIFGGSTYDSELNGLYTALAGTATAGCLFNGGPNFQSKWYDLSSVAPSVTALTPIGVGSFTLINNLRGEGAQSHPHATGVDANGNLVFGTTGIGAPDPSKTSGPVTIGAALEGWRWFRFSGVLARQRPTQAPPDVAPLVDDMSISHTTDF